jgi:hypothetical protein
VVVELPSKGRVGTPVGEPAVEEEEFLPGAFVGCVADLTVVGVGELGRVVAGGMGALGVMLK